MFEIMTPELMGWIMREIGATHMSEEDTMATIDSMIEHFRKLILDTFTNSLNESQLQRFYNFANMTADPDALEKQFDSIAVEIPGLNDKIQQTILAEVEGLKAAFKAAS